MMNDDPSTPEILPVTGSNSGKAFGVIIPCSAEEFGDFVTGLLGQPQTILTTVEGAFVIDRACINNIYNLVQQRVLQQNSSTLIQWTITIIYDDNSSVRLDSMPEFERYAEIKNHVSLGFNINFTYLVRFSDKNTPEKQTIDVSFNVGTRRAYVLSSSMMPYDAGFMIRIHHTARSWGVDLESLLIGHVSTIRKLRGSKMRSLLSKNSFKIEPFLVFLFLISAIAGLFVQSYYAGIAAVSKISASLTSFSANEKITEIARVVTVQFEGGLLQQKIILILFFVVAFTMFAIFLADIIERRISATQKGALLLTGESVRLFERSQTSESRFWLEFIAGIFAGILTGVVANYIFFWLTRRG